MGNYVKVMLQIYFSICVPKLLECNAVGQSYCKTNKRVQCMLQCMCYLLENIHISCYFQKQSNEVNETIGKPAIFTRNSFEVLSVCHIVSGED